MFQMVRILARILTILGNRLSERKNSVYLSIHNSPYTQHYPNYFWHQRCAGFFPYWPILRHQLGILQFNSISTPQVKGSVPQDYPSLQMPVASVGSPKLPTTSDSATNWRFPWPLPQVQSFTRMAHRTQENSLLTRLLVYYKGYIKGYKWTVRWRIYRARSMSRRVPSTRASIPVEFWGIPPSQQVDVFLFTNPEALWILYFRDFYGGFIM